MDWFKFHHDALNNPKVQRLSGDQFKAWVNLLCLSSQRQERGSLPCVADCAFALRLDEGECVEIMDKLETYGLLEFDEETECYFIHHWKECQYDKPSDYPENVAERVRKSRERRRNADVTPSNALDTDTEEIQIQTQKRTLTADKPPKKFVYPPDFEEFWRAYPSGFGSKKATFAQWKRLNPDEAMRAEIMQGLAMWKLSERWAKGFVKAAEIWVRDELWLNPAPSAGSPVKRELSAPVSAFELYGRKATA